jgi:hypothetical protein
VFLLLLISLELHISPNPIEGNPGERIPFSVVILDDEGKIIRVDKKFEVIPNDLGKVDGNTFIPNKKGKGILKCHVIFKDEKFSSYAYINITDKRKARITPTSAIVKPGEQTQFRILDEGLVKWKVIPEELGEINKGIFVAKSPGRGRVIGILQNGDVISAFIRVEGKISKLDVYPGFKRINIGEKVKFSIKNNGLVNWEIKPDNIGIIDDNGIFQGISPGKGLVIAKVKEGNTELIGRAIIVISGEIKARIIPEKVSLLTGEEIRFQIKFAPEITKREIPVRWKVIPKECGFIRNDGTFTAGKYPLIGRVVAIIPSRFGGGFASSRISIIPRQGVQISITPSFREIEINEEITFRVTGEIPINWKVIPEDLGTITGDGKFTPRRSGSGIIVAEPKGYINVKSGRALVIIGNNPIVNIYMPREIFERFSVPVRIITNLRNYKVFWHVIPEHVGYVSDKGVFSANPLPEGRNLEDATIYAILHRNREILGWGKFRIRIVRRRETKN